MKPQKSDVGVQTDKVNEVTPVSPDKSGNVLVENSNPMSSSGKDLTVPGQNSIMQRPLPHDVEQLRAELTAASAHIIAQESSIRSLQQSTLGLRVALEDHYKEREDLMLQLRQAQAEHLTYRSTHDRVGLDLERATMEVERLREELSAFHHPSSRTYKSVKDAVEREMRGERQCIDYFLGMSDCSLHSSRDSNYSEEGSGHSDGGYS